MRIWIIDHYSVPVRYYPLARNTNFAKHFMKNGHEVIIFAASTVHNSSVNLMEDASKYKEIVDDGVKYVLVNCHQYSGNGIRRILNMYEFAAKLGAVCDKYPKPDAIISTSMTLQACKKGIQLGKKYGCKCIAQVTDLWPETLVAYGKATKKHPLVIHFRKIEKWIYRNADKIVFSMEGAYDYIIEQGWEKDIPQSKVFYINNGVNLSEFHYNQQHYTINDEDLLNKDLFKAIYTGSIRAVNNVGLLVDAAKHISDPNLVILVWGDGDQREDLVRRCAQEKVTNIKFKGKVEKKYIPFITSNADINLAHSSSTELFRFGMSLNKMFDYAAAGKPILVDFKGNYNPVIENGAGLETDDQSATSIAKELWRFAEMDKTEYKRYCDNAQKMARQYDINSLANKFLSILN